MEAKSECQLPTICFSQFSRCLPNKPCGKAICRVADAIAKGQIPFEFVQIVSHYAVYDPDPSPEKWEEEAAGGRRYYGGNPLSACNVQPAPARCLLTEWNSSVASR